LKGQLKERNQALHTDTLPFDVLLSQVLRLLKDSARFWLILPPYESSLFQKLAREKNLFPRRIFSLKDSPNKPINRELVEFSFEEMELQNFNILLKNQDGSPSDSYSKLVSGFLLAF
jgi:tRNA1Val (adenine37-N6)-methyltransferase